MKPTCPSCNNSIPLLTKLRARFVSVACPACELRSRTDVSLGVSILYIALTILAFVMLAMCLQYRHWWPAIAFIGIGIVGEVFVSIASPLIPNDIRKPGVHSRP